jgi:hypothetical protein
MQRLKQNTEGTISEYQKHIEKAPREKPTGISLPQLQHQTF